MQDQAERDLLQCDSSALLHRWGSSSMSTHAHTEHTPSSCMLEALTPLPETHPTRASLVGQPLTKVCLSQVVSHRKHGEDPDRARGPDCAPRQPAPRASTVPRPPHRTLRTGAARGTLRLSWLHQRANAPARVRPLRAPWPCASQHDVQLDYYGKRLATCSSDRTVKVYDVMEGGERKQVADLKG